jgi:exonuclease SbcD
MLMYGGISGSGVVSLVRTSVREYSYTITTPMIKLLHLADLHIGIENYGRIDPVSGLHTRLKDYLDCLDEAIDIGLDEGVHLVLIAGDMYKNRSPNPTHQREFARRINRLCVAGVPVFMITGNHDISPAVGRANSVDIFATLEVAGVTIAHRPGLHCIDTPAGPLQIIALPWVTRHSLLAKDEMHAVSFLEIERMLRDRIDNFVVNMAAELDPAIPSVLALHGTIDGATYGAERSITLGQDLVLSRGIVAQAGVDYVALGHIHRHQVLGEHPPIVYPGSIERIDFGERDEEKGCVLVELERGAARWRFQPLKARPFVSIEVDVRGSSDPSGKVTEQVSRRNLRDAVVRVQVRARREQAALLHEDTIRQQLLEAQSFVVANVVIDIERETRSRLEHAAEEMMQGLTPRRALELYLQARDTDSARIATLLAAADELLAEEAEE